ncbi:MAG: ATP-binding protein [Pirellulaceae bacterium]
MICLLRQVLCAGVGVWAAASATAAPPVTDDERAQGYLFTTSYRPEEFGGTAPVRQVVQGENGIIYAAKHDGVLEYDGETWRRISHPHGREATSLAVDGEGVVYVGCRGDFGMLAPDDVGAMQFRSLAEDLPAEDRVVGAVNSVVAAPQGVFFQTDLRLYRWRKPEAEETASPAGTFKVFREENVFNCVSLVDGEVVVARGGYDDRLLIAREDRLEPVPKTNTIAGVIVDVASFGEPRKDRSYGEHRWLVGTAGYGLFLFEKGKCRAFNCSAHRYLGKTSVWAIKALGDGRWAIATNGLGVLVVDSNGDIERILDHTTGLSRTIVTGAMLDQERGLWLCTPYGMTRVEVNSPLEFFGGQAGLHSDVGAICRFQGRLYVAAKTGCLVLEPSRDLGKPARFTLVPGITGTCLGMTAVDDKLLVGGNAGLWEIDADENVAPREVPGYINSLFLASDGKTVYASTYHAGVQRITRSDDGQWRQTARVPGTSDTIEEMLEDTSGRLWLSARIDSEYRVERVDDPQAMSGSVTVLGESDGISPTRLPRLLLINGEVYVDTFGKIVRWDERPGRFVDVEPKQLGLRPTPSDDGSGESVAPRILSAATDADGGVWLAADEQVVRFTPGQSPLQPQHPLWEVGRRRIRKLFAEADGVMWAWAGDGALIRHDGTRTPPASATTQVPPPLIRHVASGEGRPLRSGEFCAQRPPLELPYDLASLQIDFSLPRYAASHATRYQSRLIGLDDAWSDWTDAATQRYPVLREGAYRFEVRTRDHEMRVSPATALEFRVLPPWYRTWIAYAAYAFLLAAGVYGIVTWRVGVMRGTVSRLQREIAAREQAQADSHLLQMQLIQSQKLDAVGTLAAGVAHDFNNSLAAIVTYAELAAASLPSGSREAEFTEGILRAARQASGTTKGLLTFSRSTGSEKRPTDLGPLVSDSINFLRRLLPASINTTVEVPTDRALFCQVDDTQIQQVLMNLVVNARDAMPDGGELSISVAPARGRPGFAELTVRDTGRGMSDDVRAKMFEPFFTTKSREQGTGLGMSIVHGIVSEHGGEIDVESAPERGVVVRILLPTCAPSGAASGELAAQFEGAGRTVLLTEDNDTVRAGITQQLKQLGFHVIAAATGREAIDMFADQGDAVELVVLDIDLPGKSGLDCLREIRAKSPGLPAILISGVPSVDLENLDATFLRKPFTKAALIAALQQQLPGDDASIDSDSGVLPLHQGKQHYLA